jgi:type IV pilus assembly protein PilN
MRLNINLASQPYEIAQSYQRRMTIVIAALGMAAVLLLGYILYQRQHSRGINRQLAQVQGEIRSLEHEEGTARAILNKPANREVADQSDFLNQLFARKSLSWTRIFTEMEKIVPAGLHVVSMKPEYTKTNDLVLHVIVATDSRDRAVEMVRHMESSNHLRQAQIVAETVTTTSSGEAAGGNIQFDIAAVYVPGAAENEEPTATESAPAKNGNPAQPAGVPAKRAENAPQGVGPAATRGPAAMAQPGTPTNTARNQPVRPGNAKEH